MVRSRSSTQRHQRHTPARLAWRRKSPTAVRCAASATRIWMDSSTINRTHHPAIRISSLEVVTSPSAVESCKGRTSTLLELASLELAKKAFCEPVNKYVIMSIHNSQLIDANDLDGFRGWEHSCTHTMSWFWIGSGDFGVIAFLFSLFESCSLWLTYWLGFVMPFCFSFCYLVDPTGMIVLPPRLISLAGSRSYLLGLVIEQFLSDQDSPLSKELSRRNCLHLPAFILCSSCFASSYGIRVFHGR